MQTTNFYDIKIKDIEGQDLDLAQFKGKKLIVVNVASQCGFTPQYTDLQQLYSSHKDKLVVLGVPCNDFGGQEPGTEADIKQFCTMNFGVTFPITQKVGIKNDRHPLYDWLCVKANNGVSDNEVGWNFHKFLIDERGNLINSLPSNVTPLDNEIVAWVEK